MFDRLRSLLTGAAQSSPEPDEMLSTALLLVELARSDLDVADVEVAKIRELLAARYGLAETKLDSLMADARRRGESAVSLYEYVESLNARLDRTAKAELMAMLWQVAYADGHLDKYEESLLRKIAGLLYVTDQDYITAKLAASGG